MSLLIRAFINLQPTMVIAFRVTSLSLVLFMAPAALAQVDFIPGERLAVSVGAFTQGGEASASGSEVEGLVSPRFALSVGVGTATTLQRRPGSVRGPFDGSDPAITTFMVGARGFIGRQDVNSPATVSLGVSAGVAARKEGEKLTRPIVAVTVRTLRVLPFPGDRFFVAPSGRFALTTIFDSRVAATTASFGGGMGFGFYATPSVLLAVTPNLTVSHDPGSGPVITFAATLGLTFGY